MTRLVIVRLAIVHITKDDWDFSSKFARFERIPANLLLIPCESPAIRANSPRVRMEHSRLATSKHIKGSSQTSELS